MSRLDSRMNHLPFVVPRQESIVLFVIILIVVTSAGVAGIHLARRSVDRTVAFAITLLLWMAATGIYVALGVPDREHRRADGFLRRQQPRRRRPRPVAGRPVVGHRTATLGARRVPGIPASSRDRAALVGRGRHDSGDDDLVGFELRTSSAASWRSSPRPGRGTAASPGSRTSSASSCSRTSRAWRCCRCRSRSDGTCHRP